MTRVRIDAVRHPFATRSNSTNEAVRLVFCAHYTGHLTDRLSGGALTGERVGDVLAALAADGVARTACARAQTMLAESEGSAEISDEQLAAVLRDAVEHLAQSPTPQHEWGPLRAAFGDGLLGRLVHVSATSLRRYADGSRDTPDDVAGRLHLIAMIAADLAGGYNDYGMRRWFVRPRTQLDGRSPAELLDGGFDVDGPAAQRVAALAAWVSGAGSAA